MFKRLLVIVSALLMFAAFAQTQTVLKTLVVSNNFSTTAGTPRVVRDSFLHQWLILWRQQGAPVKAMGRIVKSDGTMVAAKVLISGLSSAADNLDGAYDSTKYNFLVVYENAAGVSVQLFNGNLVKQGAAVVIEGGVSNTHPKITYDPIGQRFIVFWISTSSGAPGKVLKSRVLDATGHAAGDAKTLKQAPSGKTFTSLTVSTNQKNGNLEALLTQSTASSGDLVGFAIKRDGTLLRPIPTGFQPPTNGFNATADASFTDAGSGFTFWADGTTIKFRKLSVTMSTASPTKGLNSAGDVNSRQTSILFDSRNNQFISAWAMANTVRALALNPASGDIVVQPFLVANSSLSQARDVATSYDASVGNAIVVWEDSNVNAATVSKPGSSFKIRAAIFFIAGASSSSGVSIGDNFFAPSTLTVPAGTTVVWTHNGSSQHTVTSGNGSPSGLFDSGTLNHGQTFSFRFNDSGTFQYYCMVHGTMMSGTITVNSGSEPGPHY
jgi:plastocyanin